MALYSLGEKCIRHYQMTISNPLVWIGIGPLDPSGTDPPTPHNDSLKKGKNYLEMAAIKGCVEARYMLGELEMELSNGSDRSLKHFVIGAKAGHEPSLKCVEKSYTDGRIDKEDYYGVLREYLTNSDAMRSHQREKSKAYCEHVTNHELFNEDFPPRRKCPGCAVPLPYNLDYSYMACCGGMLCNGCCLKICDRCPFCDAPAEDDNEVVDMKQVKKRMEMNDFEAYNAMVVYHKYGLHGVKQERKGDRDG